MPIYIYQHPITDEIIEVVQAMNDKHEYIDDQGLRWQRIFVKPHAQVDAKIDPHNAKDFVEKTKHKKGTVGDLFDQSQELSEKRQQIFGADPVKEKYFDEWSKKRQGKIHPSQTNTDFTI